MIIFGSVIMYLTMRGAVWMWIASGSYIVYGIVGSIWIIVFVCPYCHFFDTRSCPCGYGQIAGKLTKKKDGSLFDKKFKRHIPVIIPLWIIPIVAGVVSLILDFSSMILILIVLFAINSFVILPLLSRKYGCAHCPQRSTCPWMGDKNH